MASIPKPRVSKLREERGSSLPLALVVSTLLMAALAIAIHFSNTEIRSAFKHKEQTCAYYVAEAGLDRTFLEMNRLFGEGVAAETVIREVSARDVAFHQGFYSVEAEEKTNEFGEPVGYVVVSEGRCGRETKTVVASVRRRLWGGKEETAPSALRFAVYAGEELSLRSLSGLLGLGLLTTHRIRIDGDIHGNEQVRVRHDYILLAPPPPIVNGYASSTELERIRVDGLDEQRKKTYPWIPMPVFDFDAARRKAREEGVYVPRDVLNISLLGLGPDDKIVFIDGDLTLTGLDLLGISLADRTFVVNGRVTGLLEVGGSGLVRTKLNLIAKEDIVFLGAVTGLQVNGVLFSQQDITIDGHVEATGYVGGKNIDIGGGILSSVLGLITGSMSFEHRLEAIRELPPGAGFMTDVLELVEQRETGDGQRGNG